MQKAPTDPGQREAWATTQCIKKVAGGTADDYRDTVIAAAKEGYIAISYEQPSIASTTCTSTGAWKTDGSYKYTFNGDPYEAPMYDAVAAGLTVFKGLLTNCFILDERGYFCSDVTVETDKIGVSGISYGGYMTTFLTALLGDYVNTAVAKFITGNYLESEYFWSRIGQYIQNEDTRAAFCRYFDPLFYADGITAKFLTVGATNDTFGSIPTLTSFYHAMTNAERRDFMLAPNANHTVNTLENGGYAFGSSGVSTVEWQYLVWGLTGEGTPPTVVTEREARTNESLAEAEFTFDRTPAKVTAYYTLSTGNWTKAEFIRLADADITLSENGAIAIFPIGYNLTYFLVVTDENGNEYASLPTILSYDNTQRPYTVTFVANGEIVSTETFTLSNRTVTEPTVPTVKGYHGKWQKYVLVNRNITVYAEYSAE